MDAPWRCVWSRPGNEFVWVTQIVQRVTVPPSLDSWPTGQLGLIGERNDRRGLPVTTLRQCEADPGLVPVVPGGFDQQAPHVPVTGARDPATLLAGATAVLARHQPKVRHQLAGGTETP